MELTASHKATCDEITRTEVVCVHLRGVWGPFLADGCKGVMSALFPVLSLGADTCIEGLACQHVCVLSEMVATEEES